MTEVQAPPARSPAHPLPTERALVSARPATIRTLREYDPIDRKRLELGDAEWEGLTRFARKNQLDRNGNYRPVLRFDRSGRGLRATNFVGVLSTSRGRPIEILPKIDLAPGADAQDQEDETRRVFLEMLRAWRELRHAELPPSAIRSLRRFPMLEAFAHLFLQNLSRLARHGLARRYVRVEDNLPFLRGRLLFQQQVRENLTNRARFYVAHDEFSPNRPANRLIRGTLDRLRRTVRNEENRRLLRELTDAFADVPPTTDPASDWRRHCVDRTMQHYRPVMAWVRLFLFRQGLATFHGEHENRSLLFPMEEVYEDFVTRCFRRYQREYGVQAQGPRKKLTHDPAAFTMKPDITLADARGRIGFILDTKWKRLKSASDEPTKRGVSQADMYQLFAYGKRYGCRTVALVYPRTDGFSKPVRFVFDDELTLLCLPFDVSAPEQGVTDCVAALQCSTPAPS